MARSSSVFICQQCGYQSPTFMGKCPECSNWNTLVEQTTTINPNQGIKHSTKIPQVIKLSDIEKKRYERISTSTQEFDRVLGGGIVLGSVVLVAGDPGIGKSTLLSHLAINLGNSTVDDRKLKIGVENRGSKIENQIHSQSSTLDPLSSTVLYVAGEESPQQIRLRIERINPKADLAFLDETDVDVISSAIESYKPKLVIVDSIQTVETTDLTAAPGSVSQVKECAHRLQKVAKRLHIPIFIVGHVTKEGTVAGPRTLEHLVDVVLSLEGDPSTNFRILRASKNRFGPTDEVGIFEMTEKGMEEVKNPSKLFLDEKVNAPGSAVTAILTGLRPMLLEIQALVTKTNSPIPRRVGTGIDNNRLQLLVAVLQKRLRLPLWDQDVFVNVTGGLKINEPGADLAICMAIISSFKDITLPPDSAFIGEVGLLGELRTINQLEKRTNESKRLGFTKVFSPPKYKSLSQIEKGLI